MAVIPTPNFNWGKPTPGGSRNVWGGELNAALDAIDSTVHGVKTTAEAALPRTGGDLTGNVTAKLKDHPDVPVAGTLALSLADGNAHRARLLGNATVTIAAAPEGKTSAFVLRLTNGGGKTITWPASVRWPGGTQPTLTTDGVDVLGFLTFDGLVWDAMLLTRDSR